MVRDYISILTRYKPVSHSPSPPRVFGPYFHSFSAVRGRCKCDPVRQKAPTFTKIDFHFIAVSWRLSSTLFNTISENNNFGLLASVLEGWKRGKNHNVPQNSIKNSVFCGSYNPKWVPDRSFKSYTRLEYGEWEEPVGCSGHAVLPTLLTGATPSKNFWFLNFTFPSAIIEFTWYIRFWHFCGFPYIAMRGLLLFCTTNPSIETGQQSD